MKAPLLHVMNFTHRLILAAVALLIGFSALATSAHFTHSRAEITVAAR